MNILRGMACMRAPFLMFSGSYPYTFIHNPAIRNVLSRAFRKVQT